MSEVLTTSEELNALQLLFQKLFKTWWGRFVLWLASSIALVIISISAYGFVIADQTKENSEKIDSMGVSFQVQLDDMHSDLATIYELYAESIDSSKSFRYEMRGNIELITTLMAQQRTDVLIMQHDIKELLKRK